MPAQTRSDRVEDGKPRSSRGGVNLRDIASTDPSRIQPGRVYRSSERFKCVCCFAVPLQLHTVFLAQQHGLRTIAVPTALFGLPRFEKTDENIASTLDLREEPSECKRPAVRKVLSGIFKAPVWVRNRV